MGDTGFSISQEFFFFNERDSLILERFQKLESREERMSVKTYSVMTFTIAVSPGVV
jgi:hypothetical protein